MTNAYSGILKLKKNGTGTLHNPAKPSDTIFVPAKLIKAHNLTEGATVAGAVRTGKKEPQLATVETICGLAPDEFNQRTPFRRLTAINPHDRFDLSTNGDMGMRLVDLIAPIGKGTRGLIVAPPKAGKTMLLEQIARAIQADDDRLLAVFVEADADGYDTGHLQDLFFVFGLYFFYRR